MMNTLMLFDRSPIWNLLGDFEQEYQRPATSPLKTVPYDFREEDDGYLLSIDLPGVLKEDLKIELSDGVLMVSGQRKRQKEEKFQLRFAIPENADISKIEANIENGVLDVAIMKAEIKKPRTIQVQAGKNGFFSKILTKKTTKQNGEKAVQAS